MTIVIWTFATPFFVTSATLPVSSEVEMAAQLVDKSGDKYKEYFMKAEHAKCKMQAVFHFRISRNYDALKEVLT